MLFFKICYKVITWLPEECLHKGKRLYGFLKNNYKINFSLESCEEFKQFPTKTKSVLSISWIVQIYLVKSNFYYSQTLNLIYTCRSKVKVFQTRVYLLVLFLFKMNLQSFEEIQMKAIIKSISIVAGLSNYMYRYGWETQRFFNWLHIFKIGLTERMQFWFLYLFVTDYVLKTG